jgi:hypothetical protein
VAWFFLCRWLYKNKRAEHKKEKNCYDETDKAISLLPISISGTNLLCPFRRSKLCVVYVSSEKEGEAFDFY